MLKPDFIIIRHKKENLQKCSLRGFESDSRFVFYTYPDDLYLFTESFFEEICLLDIEGDELSLEKNSFGDRPILLIDATWRYAKSMMKNMKNIHKARRCRLPHKWVTAYPRKQEDCPDPASGLASLEALYIASRLLKKDSSHGLLDNYYWRDLFYERNKDLLV